MPIKGQLNFQTETIVGNEIEDYLYLEKMPMYKYKWMIIIWLIYFYWNHEKKYKAISMLLIECIWYIETNNNFKWLHLNLPRLL